MTYEGVPLIVIQRRPGHSNLGITSIYLEGIDNEIIKAVHARRAPDGPRKRLPSSLTLAATPLIAQAGVSAGAPARPCPWRNCAGRRAICRIAP
jgi:hypothetical protein